MDDEVVLFFGVEHVEHPVFGSQRALVSHLATPFRIERRLVKHRLNERLFLGRHLPVAQQLDVGGGVVVSDKFRDARVRLHHLPVVGGDLTSFAGTCLLGFQKGAEPCFVDSELVFAGDECGQIHGEPEGVVELKDQVACQLVSSLHLFRGQGEPLHAGRQCAQEGLFLLLNDLLDESFLCLELREGGGHLIVQHVHECVDERFVHAQERGAVSDGAAQNPSDDVAGPGVGWELAVRDGERHGTHVVGDDPERHGLLAVVAWVGFAARVGNGVEERGENVRIVVGLDPLQRHGKTLKAHARVDVLVGQRHEGIVRHAVEFHEHEVPHFDDLGMVHVDQVAAVHLGSFVVVPEVDVDFRARPARPGFAHFPKVVLLVGGENAVVGCMLLPLGTGLRIGGQAVVLVPAEHGDVQAVFVQLVAIREQFPRPIDRLGLEVVAERPVPQHLKKRVVVGVHPHFFEVVVLAADAQALLGVRDARILDRLVPQKQILERIHPSIDEHEGGIVLHHHRRRRHNGVVLLLEKVQKCLANDA